MTFRSKFIISVAIPLIGSVVVITFLADVGERIREHYPSASVTIHEAHSPDIEPVFDVMRIVRGKSFIPATEWIEVQIRDQAD